MKNCLLLLTLLFAQHSFAQAQEHPWPSYANVNDIDAVAKSLRKKFAAQGRYSFSRSWWKWDRLRARYVDSRRTNHNELRILRAVFRGLMLDWHNKLKRKGEGKLLYIFFTTVRGDKRERLLNVGGKRLLRDIHGGGYHGGWGGAARMRLFEELVRGKMLTPQEQAQFKEIVYQSLERRFIDFKTKHQVATNHAFGNAGGVAIALRLFPDAPQAKEARAWLNRIWKHFSDYGDWKEWTYYPYGPIFLHGLIDVAEELGKFNSDRKLLFAVGQRCLGFVHGGGLRGNPNSYANATFPSGKSRQAEILADPWMKGYYRVEQQARDGHFWYRLAQHFRDPEFLWAAEQVILGGRPPKGRAFPNAAGYQRAFANRFAWFVQRGIKPRAPKRGSYVGLMSPLKRRKPERLYLGANRRAGTPFASFFVYDSRGSHLNPPEVWGTLYEYCVDGAKLLGTAGKYTDDIPGGSGAYDSLMITKPDAQFPIDGRGPMRSGSLEPRSLRAETRGNDTFGQYSFVNYFGRGTKWTRRCVLSKGGLLVVCDIVDAAKIHDGWKAGPCWQMRAERPSVPTHPLGKDSFQAPAWDHAWWQKSRKRLSVTVIAADGNGTYGVMRHRTSADISRSVRTDCFHGQAPLRSGKRQIWLSVLSPFNEGSRPPKVAATVDSAGNARTTVARQTIVIRGDGTWRVE